MFKNVVKKPNIKYTIREIFIVIIGISIAYSMNKCSDNFRDSHLGDKYLTELKNDLDVDTEQLKTNLEGIAKKIELCNRLIPTLNSGDDDNLNLLGMVFQILNYETFDSNDITYRTMINSGDLKLLDNFELKKSIQAHYSKYDRLNNIYAKHQSLTKDYLGNYMINFADYDKVEKGESPFNDELRLKNIIRALLTTLKEKKQMTEKCVESCEHLISTLTKR
jgi:hypothetical protein